MSILLSGAVFLLSVAKINKGVNQTERVRRDFGYVSKVQLLKSSHPSQCMVNEDSICDSIFRGESIDCEINGRPRLTDRQVGEDKMKM